MWIDDQIISQCHQSLALACYVPKEKIVVLGRSNKAESEVNQERCKKDQVPVEKRYGGGGTVLLHQGCVVLSLGTWVKNPYNNDNYFHGLNCSIIDAISAYYPEFTFSQKGFSDIVVDGKKFVGTSLFRSRTYLLYQASILVDLHLKDIETYLQHPSKEPDYRKGRSHKDFLIGLQDLNPAITSDKLRDILQENFEDCLRENLGDELSTPIESHIPHLLSRVE